MTYDRRTIPVLLRSWDTAGKSHAGVVFIDDRTIATGDIGGQVQSLVRLLDTRDGDNWTNLVRYLERD